MGFNFFIISCLLLAVIQTAFSAGADDNTGDHYIDQNCESIYGNIVPGSPYAANLNNLVNDLVANTSLNNGFMTASSKMGRNESEYAYGLALCRHDVPPEGCNKCLNNVSATINASCTAQVATIWHDHCLLAYANQIDNLNIYSNYFKVNESDPTEYDVTFSDKTRGLIYTLIGDVFDQPDIMFASGNATYGNETVYAMVQCSRDESVEVCTDCLAYATAIGMIMCLPKKSGRVYSGQCIARYEMFPFLASS